MAEFPPSEGARSLLTTHVAVSGWELHTGIMPDKPDRAIVVVDTGGRAPNPKWLIDFPSIQVMIRGRTNGYMDTFREAKAVKDLLLGVTSQDILDDRWVSVTQQGDLGFIGRDDNMRPLFSVNFALIIEPQSVANSNRIPL